MNPIPFTLWIGCAVVTMTACEPAYESSTESTPSSPLTHRSTTHWNKRANLVPAVDINPDPHIFETTLRASTHTHTISRGRKINLFAYNHSVPGPLIEVAQGDRVIVHLENDLPDGWNTSIHWHGIEGNNAADGTPVTQLAVEPGSSFTYDFVVTRAGTYWYHPHARGTQEVFAGLYGALIVKSPQESKLVDAGILPKPERTLVLSDITHSNGTVRNLEGPISSLEQMNGTEGNTLLVNGVELPRIKARIGEGIRLRLINTSITRYYRLAIADHQLIRYGGEGGILNSAKVDGGTTMGMAMDMPMKMCMSDDDCITADSQHPMCIIPSGQSSGMCGTMQAIDLGFESGEILLSPGERAEVVLIPHKDAGKKITLQWKDFARGRHAMDMEMPMRMCNSANDCTHPSFPTCMDMGMGEPSMCGAMYDADDDGHRQSRDILRIKVKKPRGCQEPISLVPGTPLLTALGEQVDLLGPATVNFVGPMDRLNFQGTMDENGTHFAIDGSRWEPTFGTFELPPQAPSARFASIGDIVQFEVHNHTNMHHPFHLHGFSFQPKHFVQMHHEQGEMVRWSYGTDEFVDTVSIPPHTSLVSKVRIDDPVGNGGAIGRWLFHCHILQHAALGMTSELIVSESP